MFSIAYDLIRIICMYIWYNFVNNCNNTSDKIEQLLNICNSSQVQVLSSISQSQKIQVMLHILDYNHIQSQKLFSFISNIIFFIKSFYYFLSLRQLYFYVYNFNRNIIMIYNIYIHRITLFFLLFFFSFCKITYIFIYFFIFVISFPINFRIPYFIY